MIPGLPSLQASPLQRSVPMGSITKVMTAIVALADHPLAPGEEGPSLTVTEDDVADWRSMLTSNQSNVPIAVGEQLSERQLLEGLLVRSGNDYAHLLVKLSGIDEQAFVAKMNQLAARWGLARTTYADVSGLSSGSVSTPADQLVVGRHAMARPTIAEIVSQRSVDLPVAGTVRSYTPLVGTGGVVGIKSGRTTEAGGCDLLALEATVGTGRTLVLASVFGQRGKGRLKRAGDLAYGLAAQLSRGFEPVVVAGAHVPVATYGWGSSRTGLVLRAPAVIEAWPGSRLEVSVVPTSRRTAAVGVGVEVAELRVRSGQVVQRFALVTTQRVAPEALVDRVV